MISKFEKSHGFAGFLLVFLTQLATAQQVDTGGASPRMNQGAESQNSEKAANGTVASMNSTPAWASRFEPALYLDLNFGQNELTNLTRNAVTSEAESLVTEDFQADRDTLVFGDYREGFRVVSHKRLQAGLGLESLRDIAQGSSLAKISAPVGLIPIFGADAIMVRNVTTLNEAHQVKVEEPHSLADLGAWRVGDSLLYAKRGGFVFYLGPYILGMSEIIQYFAEGTWSVYLEKVSADEVYVKATVIQLNEFGLMTNIGLTAFGPLHFSKADETFSFRFKIQNQKAKAIFADFLVGGDVREVQEASATLDSGVQYVENEIQLQKSKPWGMWNFYVGLPFLLNTTWSSGIIKTFSKKNLIVDGAQLDVHYGMYSRTRTNSAFGNKRSRQQGFYGSAYLARERNSEPKSGYFGKYIWRFADTHSNHWQLKMALREFIGQTGMTDAMVNIPTIKNLRYVDLGADLEISQANTDRLMFVAQNTSEDDFIQKGIALLESYTDRFAAVESLDEQLDPLDVCQDYGWNAESCRRGLWTRTRMAMTDMYKSLRKMAATKESDEKFTEAYAEFGRALSENAFTFQTGIGLIGESIPMTVRISGEKVSRLKLQFLSEPGTGHFRRVKPSLATRETRD